MTNTFCSFGNSILEKTAQGSAVDAGGLIVCVGDGAQAGVAEQDHERGPVPDVDDDDRNPGGNRFLGHVVVQARPDQGRSKKPDVGARENLPDGADDVPRNEHRQGDDDERNPDRPALPRRAQRQRDPERNLEKRQTSEKASVRNKASLKRAPIDVAGFRRSRNHWSPFQKKLLVPIVPEQSNHDRHHRNDRREQHEAEDRQHEEPGAVVDGLVDHGALPCTRASAT